MFFFSFFFFFFFFFLTKASGRNIEILKESNCTGICVFCSLYRILIEVFSDKSIFFDDILVLKLV